LRFVSVSRTLPVQAAVVLTPAGGRTVPRMRTRTRLPMITAVAPLPGPLSEIVGRTRAETLTSSDALPVLPALSANVRPTV
jgi:hypothetical protein